MKFEWDQNQSYFYTARHKYDIFFGIIVGQLSKDYWDWSVSNIAHGTSPSLEQAKKDAEHAFIDNLPKALALIEKDIAALQEIRAELSREVHTQQGGFKRGNCNVIAWRKSDAD